MNKFAGASPYAIADFGLVAGHTVVVVIDMQNDFLHNDGQYAKSGVDISHMQAAVAPHQPLIAAARTKNIPIIWTKHGTRNAVDGGVFFEIRPYLADGGLRKGTWGCEILQDMEAKETDWFVEKTRASAFYQTSLELTLRGLAAETIIFTGVLTNQCVSASVRDAFYRDFKPIVVPECCGTTLPHLHEPALEIIAVGHGEIRPLERTIEDIERLPLRNAA